MIIFIQFIVSVAVYIVSEKISDSFLSGWIGGTVALSLINIIALYQ